MGNGDGGPSGGHMLATFILSYVVLDTPRRACGYPCVEPSFNTGVYLLSFYVPKLTSLSARIIKEYPPPHSSNPCSPSFSAPYNLLRPHLLRAVAPPILHNDLLIVLLRPHNLTHTFILDPNSFTIAKQAAQSGGKSSRNLHEPQTRFRGGAFGVVRSLVVIIRGIGLRRKPEKGEALHERWPSSASNTPSSINAPPLLPLVFFTPRFSAHEFMRLADDIQRSLYQFDSTSKHAVV
ncbi:hypothetical protein M422DRAFT_269129 [Sphaerobolus stellatus SS14]|uniref:Uncharacterized protein n=1 Tax=Sphaerobolus stellatus (strain SS14) TaxID=990650 RepID=A0A0C9UL00_SPHS4|nr:hypothetical protein M422DRAFT_269129 [Sphaerobolus stellatus SS14]